MKKSIIISFLCFCFATVHSQSLQSDVALVSLKSLSENHALETGTVVYTAGLIDAWMKEKKLSKAILGYSNQNREIVAYYFPGSSNKKALVIAGVHGSELSAIEIARELLRLLSTGEMPFYNLVIIPTLFPDNAFKAMEVATKSKSNFGRYTTEESVDPNRQMPALGTAFLKGSPVDVYGRVIEKENQFLLQLIQDYQPSRIVNLHAIKDVTKAGIYADPRTDCSGHALGFGTDSSLAVNMAQFIECNGGAVPGNSLQQSPTALYYHDPEIAPSGTLQKRNLLGSPLAGNRGYGVSLGGWAATGVCDEEGKRDAARLITVEFPGYKPSAVSKEDEKGRCELNIQLYAKAIREIFLEAQYEE